MNWANYLIWGAIGILCVGWLVLPVMAMRGGDRNGKVD